MRSSTLHMPKTLAEVTITPDEERGILHIATSQRFKISDVKPVEGLTKKETLTQYYRQVDPAYHLATFFANNGVEFRGYRHYKGKEAPTLLR